jgi:hypothetical protein
MRVMTTVTMRLAMKCLLADERDPMVRDLNADQDECLLKKS